MDDDRSLHEHLTRELARAARAQKDSRVLIGQSLELLRCLRATIRGIDARRTETDRRMPNRPLTRGSS